MNRKILLFLPIFWCSCTLLKKSEQAKQKSVLTQTDRTITKTEDWSEAKVFELQYHYKNDSASGLAVLEIIPDGPVTFSLKHGFQGKARKISYGESIQTRAKELESRQLYAQSEKTHSADLQTENALKVNSRSVAQKRSVNVTALIVIGLVLLVLAYFAYHKFSARK